MDMLMSRPEHSNVKLSDSTASPARNGANAPPAGPRASRATAAAPLTAATDAASPSRADSVNGESVTPGWGGANMAPPTGTDDAARAAERLKRFASVSQPPSGPSGDRSRNGTPVPSHSEVKTEDRSQDNKPSDTASSGRPTTPLRPATPPARTRARSRSVESRVSERSRRDRRERDDRDRRGSRRDESRVPEAPKDLTRSHTPSDRNTFNDDTTDRKRQEDLLKAREDKPVTDDRDTRRSSRGARGHETDKEREERKARERREKKDETGQKRKRDDEVSSLALYAREKLMKQPARRPDDPRDRDRHRDRDRRDDRRKHDGRDDRRDDRRDKRDDREDRDRDRRHRDRERDPRDLRDNRDPRDQRDPRDVRDNRDPREPLRDARMLRDDPRNVDNAADRGPHTDVRNGRNDGNPPKRTSPERRVELLPTRPSGPADTPTRSGDASARPAQGLPERPTASPALGERIIEAPRPTRPSDVSLLSFLQIDTDAPSPLEA